MIEPLAVSDPDNRQWQHDRSVVYGKIGGVLEAQGDLEAALESYQDRLNVTKRLAQTEPGNAQWEHDFAVSLSKLAHLYSLSGDKKKAREYILQAKPIWARLRRLSPGIAQWKQDLDQFDRDMTQLAEREASTNALRGTLGSQRVQTP
jgi:hypothetical protein